MRQNNMTLQELLGINSDIKYQEFNIIVLLDKDKKDKKYPSSIKCYNEVLNVTAPSSLTGDFLCMIVPSSKSTKKKPTFTKIEDGEIYLKRFSGVINQLKIYFEKNNTYTKKYDSTIPRNNVNVSDNKNLCCKFVSDNIAINIFCHNETTIKPIDTCICNILNQLMDIAQLKSEQLTIVKMSESGKTKCSNHKSGTVKEVIEMLESKLKDELFYASGYDMVSSKEYYFDFSVKDENIPDDFEKHIIITGPVKDVATFSKLSHICTKIQRDGETIVMNKITNEDIKAHS